MKDILEKVDNSKHIMIVTKEDYLTGASALYTYILRLHKKVTLICEKENINNNLSFLPWFDKIRTNKVSSSDFEIEFTYASIELYEFFKSSGIKINPKMATALYAGLLQETDCFINSNTNGTIFAIAKELIESGAEYKVCSDYILKRATLASLRLKAIMLKNMTLQNSAKVAVFFICDDNLKSSGAMLEDCDEALKESLKLPSVELAVLLNIDKEYEIIKLIYKES